MNISKGNQSQGGADAIVLGNLAVDTPIEAPKCHFKMLNNEARPFSFRTDASGEAWLFFATDSGYEGTTRVFVVAFKAQFTPAS